MQLSNSYTLRRVYIVSHSRPFLLYFSENMGVSRICISAQQHTGCTRVHNNRSIGHAWAVQRRSGRTPRGARPGLHRTNSCGNIFRPNAQLERDMCLEMTDMRVHVGFKWSSTSTVSAFVLNLHCILPQIKRMINVYFLSECERLKLFT
jgi:hypothetical protein